MVVVGRMDRQHAIMSSLVSKLNKETKKEAVSHSLVCLSQGYAE